MTSCLIYKFSIQRRSQDDNNDDTTQMAYERARVRVEAIGDLSLHAEEFEHF